MCSAALVARGDPHCCVSGELLFEYFWLLQQICVGFFFVFLVRSYFYICTLMSPAAAAADEDDDESSLFNATLSNKKIPKCIYSGHVDQKGRRFRMMQFNSFEVLSSQEAV